MQLIERAYGSPADPVGTAPAQAAGTVVVLAALAFASGRDAPVSWRR